MDNIVKEVNIGGSSKTVQELLDSLNGINSSNLLTAIKCLGKQYDCLKEIVKNYMDLRYEAGLLRKNEEFAADLDR